jgi:drug/metabolite transporter (DMT)-like permease
MPPKTPTISQRRNLILGIGLMVLSVFLFPLKDSFVKLLDGQYSAIQVVWTQFTVTAVVFFALILVREGKSALLIRAPLLQILRALFVTAGMGTFYWAIILIPLAEATAMQFIAPLVVTALSPFLLGEKVGVRRWLSVITGFAGVLIVLQPQFGGEQEGYFIALISGLCIGFFFILNRKLASRASPIASIAYSALLGAIMVSPLVPSVWITPASEDLWLIAGFLTFALTGQAAMFSAFHFGEATLVSPFHYVQIVGATLFGYLFFSQFPEPARLSGIAIIIASGIYIALREARKSRAGLGGQ